MNTRIRRSLISYARKLSLSWEPRTRAKELCKVAPALHRCSKCGTLCYEGSSEKNYQNYVQQYSPETVLFEGIKMDHISPVVDPTGAEEATWENFFKNLFCDQDNFRGICDPCHDKKTSTENKIRNTYYRPKKKGKK